MGWITKSRERGRKNIQWYNPRMPAAQQRFFRLLLTIFFVAAFLRIAGYALLFARENLQMDFASFYTAGQAMDHGLSPYQNYLNEPSGIWDGINILAHSRFHYPPLAANFFQIFTLLPFQSAKVLWTGIEALCLWASLVISLKVMQRPPHANSLLVLGTFACLSYPVLILFERGQVDTLTLLLLVIGFAWIVRRRKTFWAGILFALAALLKLNCVYIFPFLVLRRQWKAAGGFVAGGIGLFLLSTLLNGPASSLDYIREEIPYISNFGQITVSEEDPFMQTFQEVVKDLPAGYTLKDGHRYRGTLMLFDENATLVRTRISTWIKTIARRLFRWELNVSSLSLLYFGVAFSLFVGWERRQHFLTQEAGPAMEVAYWQIPLVMILLCAPLTWVMSCVWLLPAAPVFIWEISQLGSSESMARWRGLILSICAGTLGLLLVAIPDAWGFRMLVPYGENFVKYKYVLGELFVLGGLMGILHVRRSQETAAS